MKRTSYVDLSDIEKFAAPVDKVIGNKSRYYFIFSINLSTQCFMHIIYCEKVVIKIKKSM